MAVAAQPEQRSMRRFGMQLPVQVKAPTAGGDVLAVTRDVSARGVFIFFDGIEVTRDSDIEFTLTLPPEITMTQGIRVHCRGQVVRVEQNSNGGKSGMAIAIDHYRFMESEHS